MLIWCQIKQRKTLNPQERESDIFSTLASIAYLEHQWCHELIASWLITWYCFVYVFCWDWLAIIKIKRICRQLHMGHTNLVSLTKRFLWKLKSFHKMTDTIFNLTLSTIYAKIFTKIWRIAQCSAWMDGLMHHNLINTTVHRRDELKTRKKSKECVYPWFDQFKFAGKHLNYFA